MSIDGIPKVKGGTPSAGTKNAGESGAETKRTTGAPPEAMEKPSALSQPDAASTHPVRQAPAGQSQHERELARLRKAMRADAKSKLAAGKHALALAASYRMRRSRGTRRQAIDLCDDVALEVEELAELARSLGTILKAEGDLHETSAQATLRACRTLVDFIDEHES